MADVPDYIVLTRHRDLVGLRRRPWPRDVVLALLALFALLGLLDVFGQRPQTANVSAQAARFQVYGPTHLRGGLLFSARFRVTAERNVKNAILVLDPGWLEGMAVNTIEPSPIAETSRDGKLALRLGHVPRGQTYTLYMQFQVNPTNVAWRRPAGVTLLDGPRTLARIDRSYTIYP